MKGLRANNEPPHRDGFHCSLDTLGGNLFGFSPCPHHPIPLRFGHRAKPPSAGVPVPRHTWTTPWYQTYIYTVQSVTTPLLWLYICHEILHDDDSGFEEYMKGLQMYSDLPAVLALHNACPAPSAFQFFPKKKKNLPGRPSHRKASNDHTYSIVFASKSTSSLIFLFF